MTDKICFTLNQDIQESNIERLSRRGHRFEIISKTAYLIGISESIFKNPDEPPMYSTYETLDRNKKARIIRHCCILRTKTQQNFQKICKNIQQTGKSLMSQPDLIPEESMKILYEAGINIYSNKIIRNPNSFTSFLNQTIMQRIGDCRDLFPEWLNWNYISDLFIMPNGENDTGIKAAASLYYEYKQIYPYQNYINWKPDSVDENIGNILYCDDKFITILYQINNDRFEDMSLVCDVSDETKDNIYDFINTSNKCIVIVDCENSDPYNLCSAFNGLDSQELAKIQNVILYYDPHASSAWEQLNKYINVPVELVPIERIKENKSVTDMKIAMRVSLEFTTNNVDSFLLASSDSDYWAMMECLSGARFLMLLEYDKSSPILINTLKEHDISYCYINRFHSEAGEDMKRDVIQSAFAKIISASLSLNLYDIMSRILADMRINMTDEETEKFLKKYIKNKITLEPDDEGNINLKYNVNYHALKGT